MKKIVVPAILLTLLLLSSVAEAQQNNQIDHSIQSSNQPVIVNLRNTTNKVMTILWVGFNGKEENFGTLNPGQVRMPKPTPATSGACAMMAKPSSAPTEQATPRTRRSPRFRTSSLHRSQFGNSARES